jgi:large subunit ribosomal protein L25
LEARNLVLDPRELESLMQAGGENALIDLAIASPGKKEPEKVKVIIRDLHFSPLGTAPDHVDFYQVSLDRKITIPVAIEIVGECAAVSSKQATFSQQLHEVTVECLPGSIPEKIEADISSLDVGGALHLRDLVLPEGVELAENLELSVASVTALKEEAVEEEVAPELETAEPEVIGEEGSKPEEASGE